MSKESPPKDSAAWTMLNALHKERAPHHPKSPKKFLQERGHHMRERHEAFTKSARVLHQSFKDMSLRQITGLAVHAHSPVESTGHPCPDVGFAEEAAYYMRYAAAAYGWKVTNGLFYNGKVSSHKWTAGFTLGPHANTRGLVDHIAEIEPEDIIHSRWQANLYEPSWCMVRDRVRRSIVVIVRGTLSGSDTMVDLVAEPVPFTVDGMEGYVHEGMIQAAERMRTEVIPRLLEALGDTPDYDVVVVGHSLGAGVAALLTVIARSKNLEIKPRCFAYAPPAVLSENLAIKAQQLSVNSFVLNADIVPRLSIRSLNELTRAAGKEGPPPSDDVLMLPPGNVFFLWSPTHHLHDCRLEFADPQDFASILNADRKFRDHLPSNYEKALAAAVCNMRGQSTAPVEWTEEEEVADQDHNQGFLKGHGLEAGNSPGQLGPKDHVTR